MLKKIYLKDEKKLYNYKNNIIIKKNYKSFNYYISNINLLDNNKIILINQINKENICYNEILLEEDKRKVYLDFDLKIPYFDNCESFENLMILDLNKYLKEYLEKHIPSNKKYRIMYLKGSRKENNFYKISYHVIVNNYGTFTCHNKLENFINNFKLYLPQYMSGGIDINVYHSIQNFRLFYSKSSKFNDNRGILIPKKIENNEIIDISIQNVISDFWDFFVKDYMNIEDDIDNTVVNNKKEKYIKTNKKNNSLDININIELINNIKKIEFINNVFEIDANSSNNEIISLRRNKKAECIICNKFHESDNAYIKKSNNNNWFFHCHREKMYGNTNGLFVDIINNNNINIIKKDTLEKSQDNPDVITISNNIKSRSFKRVYNKFLNFKSNQQFHSANKNADLFKIEFLNINKKFDKEIYKKRLNLYLSNISEKFLLYSKITSFNILDLSSSAFESFLKILQFSRC
jgi:hypothetical protein